jgi:heat-inducible transcriptional repressor
MKDRRTLTPRQTAILKRVVSEYITSGHPVGSKALVQSGAVAASPSTVRYELAELEALGLLDHPHTSAGRVPTDAGYRMYVEGLLEEPLGMTEVPVDLSPVRDEIESALRTTTEMLAQVTSLLALVSAPPLETTEIRHIEVLPLQPQVVMVVVITSTGGVTKKIFGFDAPVDRKLAEWAGAFLNEQLTGVRLGARMMHARLAEPGLSPRERAFLDVLRPAFTELVAGGEEALYVGGAARLLEEMRFADVAAINDVMRVLEERVALLSMLRESLASPRLLLRIGSENTVPHMRGLSLVAANYGLATRNLGTVSLIGPTRMDYARAIRAVRGAAAALSAFVADVYEE